MPELSTNCILCSESTSTEISNSTSKGKGQAKILTQWKKKCVLSFCTTLRVSSSCLHKTCFCFKCQQLLRDMDFLVRSIHRFQTRLKSLKTRAKAILAINAKQFQRETHLYAKKVKRIVACITESESRSLEEAETQEQEEEDTDSALALHPVSSNTVPNSEKKNDDGGSDKRPRKRKRVAKHSNLNEWSVGSFLETELKVKDEPQSDPEDHGNWDPVDESPHTDSEEETKLTRARAKVKNESAKPKTKRRRKGKDAAKTSGPETEMFRCTVKNCSAFSRNPVHIRAHVLRDHEGDPNPYQCELCPLKFRRIGRLQTHGQKAHGIPLEKHCCPYCERTYRFKQPLAVHISEFHSSGPEKEKCSICAKSFENGDELNAHLDLHKAVRTTDQPFSCVICTFNCANMLDLQEHVRKEHEEGYLKCPKEGCDKVFLTNTRLKRHIRFLHPERVRPDLTCSICSYHATAPSVLARHMLKHEVKNQSFTCDREGCGRKFSSENNMKRHLNLYHDRDPSTFLKCTLCPKTFRQASSLRGHQAHHSTARPFLCEHCPGSFKTLINLRTHYKVHEQDPDGRKHNSPFRTRKARLPPVANIEDGIPPVPVMPPVSLEPQPQIQSNPPHQNHEMDSIPRLHPVPVTPMEIDLSSFNFYS